MLHLESGLCESRMGIFEINTIAVHECSESDRYMILMEDDEDDGGLIEYLCPASACERQFPFMSALLQHSESLRCDIDRSQHGPLQIFLDFLKDRMANPTPAPNTNSVSDDSDKSDDPGAPLVLGDTVVTRR